MNNSFTFKDGRLWASIGSDKKTLALIDSGASISIFPADQPFTGVVTGHDTISTPFGERELEKRVLFPLMVGAGEFSGEVLIGDVSYPILGADFLFSKNYVIFSKSSVDLYNVYDGNFGKDCVPIALEYASSSQITSVSSIYFIMNIDGKKHAVFFDTGREPVLTATAKLPKRSGWSRRDLSFNSLGQWAVVPYQLRTSKLEIGSNVIPISYRHYHNHTSVDAPFVMGAGILNQYSIIIDLVKGRACFIAYP